MATITGTAAGETLNGTRLQDDILGLGGDDTIRGRAGNDMIDGGTEDDLLIGRTGSDNYWVDSELDKVVERLGEGDSDTVFATISFTLRRNIENLELRGEAARGYGNDLNNRLTVEEGPVVDQVLNGRGGADYMAGGSGNDIYYVDDAGDVVEEVQATVSAQSGNDIVRSSVSFDLSDVRHPPFTLARVENLFLIGTGDIDGTGDEFDDEIRGNIGDNSLFGLGANDVLMGRDGNDSLYGGVGVDLLIGGAGEDGFYLERLDDPTRQAARVLPELPDFTPADDTIYLDRTAYTEIPEGPLPRSAFQTIPAADDSGSPLRSSEVRIFYDPQFGFSGLGAIYYDPDGNGAEPAIRIALVPAHLEINASDFVGY
ncbi:MAG TPA: calcium-binding protein [Allosphingosinicella sp.]|jgi:Ca2+-binding RTX toxin-like protein